MSITTILFDLDGTLLPMDQEIFISSYFGKLAAFLAPHGYDPKRLVDTVWQGTVAMIKNDGSKTNEKAFWDLFTAEYGSEALKDITYFDEFYQVEFNKVKEDCGYNPMAAEVVKTLKEKGYRIALATNPLFPSIATEHRIRWAGLEPSDFELYTTYENCRHSKPYPAYYVDVANALGVKPEECLMVGNDVGDDMVAEKLGMKVFLLTDCLINKKEVDISAFPNGSFKEFMDYIDTL